MDSSEHSQLALARDVEHERFRPGDPTDVNAVRWFDREARRNQGVIEWLVRIDVEPGVEPRVDCDSIDRTRPRPIGLEEGINLNRVGPGRLRTGRSVQRKEGETEEPTTRTELRSKRSISHGNTHAGRTCTYSERTRLTLEP